MVGGKMGLNRVVLANNLQAFVEETSMTRALNDGTQLSHVQPYPFAPGADINFQRSARLMVRTERFILLVHAEFKQQAGADQRAGA